MKLIMIFAMTLFWGTATFAETSAEESVFDSAEIASPDFSELSTFASVSVNGGIRRVGRPGYIYNVNGFHGGVPVGWGYIVSGYWPINYWLYANWNGYSYYPYYNYRPYYASYSVIAYSPEKGKYGVSWGGTSRESATKAAEAFCGDETCKPVVWVQGGCAALMVSNERKIFTWGTGNDRGAAVFAAKSACGRRDANGVAAKDCKPLAWSCSF